jgi:transposase
MAYIQSYKEQSWLLPPSIEDLIPQDHVCFLIEGLVDAMDYSAFDIRYSGAGHPAYHPRILLKVLLMGVLDRVRSSRKLARHARENVVYMYLSEKLSPDFRTISDFRKSNHDLVKEAFKHTVTLAREEGLLDLSHLSTDGSKIKANAANKRILTKEELAVLLGFVEGELVQWAEQDENEDKEFGELRGYEQLREQSKKKVQRAAQHYMKQVRQKGRGAYAAIADRLTEAQQEVDGSDLKKVSTTDPESRFMRNKKGKIELAYNPQLTVDRNGFILASEVSQDSSDTGQLIPQVLQTEDNIGALPEAVKWSFDAGYYESENIKFLSDKAIDGYVSCQEANHEGPYDKSNFTYDAAKDEYCCPAQKRVVFVGKHYDKVKKKTVRIYRGTECADCHEQRVCTRSKIGVRQLKVFPYENERHAMIAKMSMAEAQSTYRLRQQMVEPVFGDIKENKGMIGFLTRGIRSVRTEFSLVCIARNIKRIWDAQRARTNPLTQPPRGKSIGSAFSLRFSATG